MSGPKCNTYQLSNRERQRQIDAYNRQLKREREEARRKAKEARQRAEAAKKAAMEEDRKRKIEEARERDLNLEKGVEDTIRELELLEVREQQGEYNALLNQYTECYEEYTAAAELAGVSAESFEFHEETAQYVIAYLKKEVERLANIQIEKMCQEETARIFRETLRDMGYEVIAEKTVNEKSGAMLLSYDENTAINVLESGEQFVMEVVEMDTTDRRADADEVEKLFGKMNTFCKDYEAIQKRIEQDGRLVSKEVYHMQPDRKYARVVNLRQYEDTDRVNNKVNEYRYDRSTSLEVGVKNTITGAGYNG